MDKFSSINQFRHVVKSVLYYVEDHINVTEVPTLSFTGTVKLHGSNVGVHRLPAGFYQPHSKTTILTAKQDHHSFAKFIENEVPIKCLDSIFNMIANPEDDVTLYGEWIGPGIQKGCAIHKLPNKQWVIFGAKVNGEYVQNRQEWADEEYNIHNILDVPQYNIDIDFNKPSNALAKLEEYTLQVEGQCPWGTRFGAVGIGEGIVWTCNSRPGDSGLWFKVKGDKHASKKHSGKVMVTIDPQKVESIEKCIEIIVTHGRLTQGFDYLEENNLDIEMKNMGSYLKWVSQDILKEELDTIEANGLEWKDVVKHVNARAREFFVVRYNEF